MVDRAQRSRGRRRALLAAGLLLFAGLGAAAGVRAADADSPEAFVRAIYERYIGDAKTAHGVPLDSDAAVRRYFAPKLAARIIADRKAAAKRNEPPALDGDPFVDAQDWQIAALDIAIAPAPGESALATVRFTNFAKPARVRLDLVKLKGRWQIADIHWREGSLSTLLGGK